MTGKARSTARAALAGLVLVLLLVGVPIALVAALGWPLPRVVPAWSEIRRALEGGGVSDRTILKAIACVVWIAWFQVAVSAVVELTALVRGTLAHQMPGLPPGMQAAVARLVGSVVIGLSLASRPAAAEPVRLTAAVNAERVAVPAPLQAEPELTSPEATSPPEAAKTWTVGRHQSLWGIAQQTLGSGHRWREIWDLNRGREQPDGRTLNDPSAIEVGWVLLLPPEADVPVASGSLYEVVPGDTLAEIAEAELGDADRWPELWQLNQGRRQGDGGALADPDLIRPGWLLATPAQAELEAPAPREEDVLAPADEPSPREEPAAVTPPPTQAVTALRPPAEPDAEPDDSLPALVPVAIGGIGLFAAGVVVTVERLRRVQQRKRMRGRAIPGPSGRATAAERRLRSQAAPEAPHRLDAALRCLGMQVASGSNGRDVGVEAATFDGSAVEVLLTGDPEADPGPFQVSAGARAWTLPAEAHIDHKWGAHDVSCPVPAMTAIGVVDDRQVLVDLEWCSRTRVLGSASGELLVAMAMQSSTSEWSEGACVVWVGPAPAGLEVLDRVSVTEHLADVIDDLEAEARATEEALDAAGFPSTFAARSVRGADSWPTTLVFVVDQQDPEVLHRLLDVASATSGTAVVVREPEAGQFDTTITAEPTVVTVDRPPLSLSPLPIDAGDLAAVGELIELAASDEFGPLLHEAADIVDAPMADVEVRVAVLGPVEVIGGKAPIDRRKARELFVYLALHPDGVGEGRLKTELWPDGAPSQGTFNQTVSRARSCLGTSADGGYHLPHVVTGIYRVAPTVRSDIADLEAAALAAGREPRIETMAALRQQLARIRGLPFSDTRGGYEWAFTEGLAARSEAVCADAAHLLAEWSLEQEDTRGAIEAATQGLLASPGDERLFRVRMLAHDLAGNPAGVESVMRELCAVVDALEPYDSLHPETVALYERLARHLRGTG